MLVEFALGHMTVQTNVCSRQRGDGGYELPPRTVPDYNLIFVTRGRPVWVIDDHEHEMEPGVLVIVPPRVRHHAYCRTRRYDLGSLHVEATLPGGQDVFALLQPPRVVRFAPGTPLDAYLRGSLAEFDRAVHAHAHLMLRSWARLATIELLRQCHEQGQLQPQSLDPVVTAVLDRLTRRPGAATSLDELARFAGYTPQHLNRMFRRVLGVTPLQHLMRLRMEQGAAMLRDGPLTVAAVARACGFEDPHYFSRAFRQHYGRSPAQYRAESGSFSPPDGSADPWP